MVSADARARPIAHRAAFEAQIPTEVLRQDESRRPVHHEGDAGETALPIPRRTIDWPQVRGRQSADCRSTAATLESVPQLKKATDGRVVDFRLREGGGRDIT
jgi:hypothetical protein